MLIDYNRSNKNTTKLLYLKHTIILTTVHNHSLLCNSGMIHIP